MPSSLTRAFAHAREYLVIESEYRNGESQRGLLVVSSRKRWRLVKRLTPTLLVLLAYRRLRFFDAFQQLVREDRMPIRFAYSHYYGFEGNENPSAFYLRFGDMAGLGTDKFWNVGMALGNIDEGPPMFCSTMEAPPNQKKREFCRNAPGSVFEKAVRSETANE